MEFVSINSYENYIYQAADILFESFKKLGNNSWPTIEKAKQEVMDCIEKPNICIGLLEEEELLGWIGLRPMYSKTWEMHPLVVKHDKQNKGIGKLLLHQIENIGKQHGVIGIVLGTDDDSFRTSLSSITITSKNIFNEINNIRNLNNHPYEFYQKCGHNIVGIIPNANGINKPDIWMWKNLV